MELESPFRRVNGSAKNLYEAHSSRQPLSPLVERAMGDALGQLFGTVSLFSPQRGGATELLNPYRESWAVYSCCQLLAKCIGGIPLRVYESEDPEAKELPESDPIRQLFDLPTTQMTGVETRQAGVIHRKLSGEDFWFLADDQGQPVAETGEALIDTPTQIIAVSGYRVRDKRDAKGRIVSVRYTSGATGGVPEFPIESVLHFADYNPDDPQRGLGAAQVAMRQLETAFQCERHQESIFRAGGPSYFLTNEVEADPLVQERDQKVLEDQLNAAGPGKPRILRGKWQVHQIPADSKNLGVEASLNWSMNVVCSLMDVPPPCIGIIEQTKYSNMETAWRQLWLGVASYLKSVEEVLNKKFFPRLKDARASRYRVRFDLSEVDELKQDETKLYELALEMTARGVGISYRMACQILGLEIDEKIEGLDERFVLNTMTPLDPATAKLVNDAKPLPPAPVAPDAPAKPAKQPKKARTQVWANLTASERAAYQARFEKHVQTTALLRVYTRVRAYLVRYEQAQLEQVAAVAGASVPKALVRVSDGAFDEQLLLERAKWDAHFAEAVKKPLTDAFQLALEDMASELGVLAIPMSDPDVVEALAKQLTKLVEGVNSRLALRVKEVLIARLGEPATISDLRQAVKAELPELTEDLRKVFGSKDARALTIARTEVGIATSSARIQQMIDAGVETIEWVSSHDDHVRSSHVALDGQKRKLGEEFKPNLRWPSDEEGPAAEVINCRCVPRPIIEIGD